MESNPEISLDDFDPDGLLYPVVLGYLTKLHGFLELVSRGLISGLREDVPADVTGEAVEVAARKKFQREGIAEFVGTALRKGGPTPLLIGLELQCEVADSTINVDHAQLASEVRQGVREPIDTPADHLTFRFHRQAAGNLLIIAKARTEEHYDEDVPIWQFLRHCRNGAAHDGRFNFGDPEGAEWRGVRLTEDLVNTRVLQDGEGNGLLQPGDPILLLYDIEQNHLH